jgi:hypothetical protein
MVGPGNAEIQPPETNQRWRSSNHAAGYFAWQRPPAHVNSRAADASPPHSPAFTLVV